MIKTDRDGRRYKVVGQTNTSGHKSDIIEMIPETENEIIRKFCNNATVFSVPRGVGIAGCGYLYLYPNGTIHNGAGDGVWQFKSEEHANNFLQDFKEKHKLN